MRILFLFVLLLAGCVNSNFNEGMENAKKNNFNAAFYNFKKCYEQDNDSRCAAAAGLSAEAVGDMNTAKDWYTLAARYGQPQAISWLTAKGWPVPVADLANQSGSTDALDLTNSFLKGYNQGTQSHHSINCTSNVIGSQVYTNCN